MCETCVFRPGNLMQLKSGRVKDLVDGNREAGSALQCHKTLPYGAEQETPAICRGYWDGPGESTTIVRMAKAMGVVAEVSK
jgi:hypothetical protein